MPNPRPGDLVHPRRVEQAVARGQVQARVNIVKIVRPAHRRHVGRARDDAAVGLHVQRALADLDPRGAAIELGDELVFPANSDASEHCGIAHREARVARERAAQTVARGHSLAVEIEPHAALEGELVRGRIGVATPSLDERKGVRELHRIRGEALPRIGQGGLRRIDREHALHVDDPIVVHRLEDPNLVAFAPRAVRLRTRDLRDGALATGGELDREHARPHLHADVAIGLHPRRDRRLERERQEAVRERAAEELFTVLSRSVNLDPRHEAERNVVDDLAMDDELERVALFVLGGLLKPNGALCVAVRGRHASATKGEREEARLFRNVERLGHRVPEERARENVIPALEEHRGLPSAIDHGRARSAPLHLEGPALRVARQGHPRGRLHVPLLREFP